MVAALDGRGLGVVREEAALRVAVGGEHCRVLCRVEEARQGQADREVVRLDQGKNTRDQGESAGKNEQPPQKVTSQREGGGKDEETAYNNGEGRHRQARDRNSQLWGAAREAAKMQRAEEAPKRPNGP